jgi:uroporphyrin-III C-methyltransferase
MPVCFVSAGPGAADLITLRGLQRLGEAAVVLHDALTDPLLRAFAPKAEWIDVGKRGFAHAVRQARSTRCWCGTRSRRPAWWCA